MLTKERHEAQNPHRCLNPDPPRAAQTVVNEVAEIGRLIDVAVAEKVFPAVTSMVECQENGLNHIGDIDKRNVLALETNRKVGVSLDAFCHDFEHPEQVRAKAYDFVCNGIEVGGGSLRIHDTQLQEKMFEVLGFTKERAEAQFGFLMNAFKYGAPPHAGLAFGLDRFVSIFAGLDSIRDCIAFPKNNSGRDVMLDAPGELDQKQLDELQIKLNLKA